MTGDRLAQAADDALVAWSLYLIASAPTPEHADALVGTARERGATDDQLDHALGLMRQQQAACVRTIPTPEGDPRQ